MNINQSHSIKRLPTESVPSEASAHCSLSVPPFLLGEIKAMKAEGKIKSISQFFTILCWDELRRLGRLRSANVSFTTSPPKSASNPSNSLDKAQLNDMEWVKIDCPRYGRIRKAQCPKLIRTADCEKCKHNPSKKADKGCYNCLHYQSDLCADCNDDFSNWAPQDEDTQGAGIERKLEAPE